MKKSKAKVWLIAENNYRVPINLILSKERDAAVDWIAKNYADKGEDLSFISKAGGHFLWKAKKKDVCIIITDPNDLPCLAHELLHYAVAVLEHRGVPIDDKTSEALTYLHQGVYISCLLALGHKKFAGSCVK